MQFYQIYRVSHLKFFHRIFNCTWHLTFSLTYDLNIIGISTFSIGGTRGQIAGRTLSGSRAPSRCVCNFTARSCKRAKRIRSRQHDRDNYTGSTARNYFARRKRERIKSHPEDCVTHSHTHTPARVSHGAVKGKVGQGFPCAITISAPYVMSTLTTVGSRKKKKQRKAQVRAPPASIVVQCQDDFRDGWW